MGKEHDLINAAKSGNVAQIEKILGQKSKKSGLHSIMGRNVNPNYQDEMGYSPLHYAAMNGHRGAAELLLKYDASTNIPDHSGNYPLHLASFNGHAEVSRILINTGPSRANVNEQNGTEDTALHSAAQYGYNQVVAVLLENHADPYIRNCRQESSLDLAAQYGRIETVKLLLNYHPNLLQSLTKTHTPLHLAARNGHISVVTNLLGCGMSVNTECDTGTALHEAALFGKLDVCNLLLQCDVDIKVKDKNQQTVMDLLMSHPSAKTKEISTLIYNHSQRRSTVLSASASFHTSSSFSSETSDLKHTNSMPPRSSTLLSRRSNYDEVPGMRPFSGAGIKRSDTYDSVPPHPRSQSQASYDFVPLNRTTSELPPSRPADRPDTKAPVAHGYASVKDMTTVIPREGTADYLTSTQSSYDFVPHPQQAPAGRANQSTKPDSKPLIKPSIVDGYAYVMASDPTAATTDPILTPQNVKDGYTMLGVPVQPHLTASPPKHQHHHPPPRQDDSLDDYSTVRHETGQTPPDHPPQAMDTENGTYFQVGSPQSGSQSHRPGNTPPRYPAVYEVPPPQRDPPEGEYGLIGAVTSHPSRPTQQPTTSLPTRPTQQPTTVAADVGGGTYDMVSLPRVSSPTYEIPPPFKSREEDNSSGTYGLVERPQNRTPTKPCPLDIPQYEMINIRNPGTMGPETEANASLPGYELMGPSASPGPDGRFSDYEVLAPSSSVREYMNVIPEVEQPTAAVDQSSPIPVPRSQSASSTYQRGGSSAPIYEIAPRPISAEPASASATTQSPPIYEIAPTPRPRPPPREPTESLAPMTPATRETNEGPRHGSLIKDEPVRPPRVKRPINEYQQSPVKPAPYGSKTGIAPPYEQVRVEGPQGKVNLDQIRQLQMGSSAGEYCTLNPDALGITQPPPVPPRDDTPSVPPRVDHPPIPPRIDMISGSSDVSDTPGIPPPSPTTAEVAVFEAFTPDHSPTARNSDQGAINTMIETIPEETNGEVSTVGVVHRDRPVNHPVPAPRRESLNDRQMDLSNKKLVMMARASSPLACDEKQDPFHFPPSKRTEEVPDKEVNRKMEEKKSGFASLHKNWSPFGSREDLTEEAEPTKEAQPTEEAQPSGFASSALIYENVLFKRTDSMPRGSNKPSDEAVKAREKDKEKEKAAATEAPQEYRLSALDASSPLDESAEWEKIEAFLSSIGNIEIPTFLDDQIADAGKATTVAEWLQALGVAQYESDIVSNGFDDLNFLNGGILEDQDLLEVGVLDLSHRKIILEAVKSLPAPLRLSDPGCQSYSSARDWLGSLCLNEYAQRFEHQGYSSMDRVSMIWEVELTSVLDISSLGHRKRMLASLATPRRLTMARKKENTELLNSVNDFGLEEKLAELNMYFPDEKPAVSKDATAEPVVQNAGAGPTTMAEELINSEVLKKTTEERKKQSRWRHDPEVLLKGSVNYTTQYLGSHMVKEITGISSTIDACRKMRLSTAKLQKVPSVVLSISVSGIKFIDARSKLLVSYHDMRNVSYITQDPEDKRVFAYIAKDAKVDKHYCHVFRVEKKNLSDEVTMSIGQAFELAYEQFVEIQKHLSTQAQKTSS